MKKELEIRQKGNIMEKTYKYEDIEQILAEADDLLQQIDPEVIEYLKEEQRAQLEEQVQSLKKLKSEVEDKIGKEGPSKSKPYSEGMHEAIEDIAKAMKALASHLS
jgi:CDGSH-type Zn-finger protein